jgi:hypothetical protein
MNLSITAPGAERIFDPAQLLYAIPAKPVRLIEKACINPIETIAQISPFIEDLRDTHLPNWLNTALINENSVYNEPDQRMAIFIFYEYLIRLIDGLLAISNQNKKAEILPSDSGNMSQPIFLNDEQTANPKLTVTDFCKKYPVEYTRRELWHFLEAGVSLATDYPKDFCPGFALISYDYVSCLTEAAYCLNREKGDLKET